MKKQLLSILTSLFFLLLLIGQDAKAQMPTGSICPDFTGTDLNGGTWHLYDLLDQGKTVVIDVSAAWCGPCWGFHNMHTLKDIWNHHGPSGTISQDMVALFIEGEGQNTEAQLHGTSGSGALSSQGDWVTGEPYPFIDDANIANTLQTGSFPTIYVVCPDRSVTEIYWEDATDTALYALSGSCALSTTTLDAGIMEPALLNPLLIDCDSVDISARLCNYGSTALTSATIEYVVNGTVQDSYAWTGSLATYENAIMTNGGTVTGSPGDHTVTIRVTNPNNGSDLESSNNSKDQDFHIYETTGGGAFSNDMESGQLTPAGWHFLNAENDGYFFIAGNAGYNSDKGIVAEFYYAPNGNTYELYAPEINLSTFTNPVVEFDVAHAAYSNSAQDKLKVMAMTCSGTWVELYNKKANTNPSAVNALSTVGPETSGEWVPSSDSDWRHDVVPLTQFSNDQSVVIKFVAISGYGNTLLIDNINVRNGGVGIEESKAEVGLQVYPNPFSNQTNVYYNVEGMEDVTVRVYNLTGQEVYTNDFGLQTAGQHNFQINGENLASGMYVMNLNIGNKTVSHKLSVTK